MPMQISRPIWDLSIKLLSAQDRLRHILSREPSKEEIAKELKVNEDDVDLALNLRYPVVSIYNPVHDNSPFSILDSISSNSAEDDQAINKVIVKDLLSNLDLEERHLINLRYYKNKSQQEVADIYGVSQAQISRHERKILDKLRMKGEQSNLNLTC
jgi:RNA polymerase sporulation-specific sigma factor